jgi:DNA-binding response OmpR family regulator
VTARIAVIDDEAPNRSYLETLLGTAGFEVQVAAGGDEGIALVEKERPDLVLVDLMMPEVDGFAVCERIRKGPAGAGTQIIVLSALDAVDGKVRALELGADDYLVKPVESRELVSRIKVMIDRADRLRQQGSQARGRLIVVAGAKGGIGTSTVAINLAASQAASKGADAVVLADLAVPVGTLGSMLNIEVADGWAWGEGLGEGVSVHRLRSYLMRNPQIPFRLLPGVRRGSEYRDISSEAISNFATALRGLAETIVVDLGNQPSPFAPPLLREADVICVVVEPEVICVELTGPFLDRLRSTGILSHRIRLVISNPHGSLQLSRTEVAAALLKIEVAGMILYQRDDFSAASKRRLPIVIQQPQGPPATQFKELLQALTAV